jgi:hypothetical protein
MNIQNDYIVLHFATATALLGWFHGNESCNRRFKSFFLETARDAKQRQRYSAVRQNRNYSNNNSACSQTAVRLL